MSPRCDDPAFLVIATDTMHNHTHTWMQRHLGGEDHAFVTDVTGGFAQINVQGPRARELLAAVTDADVSDAALPFRSATPLFIGYAQVYCMRLTYVGELGYELFVPAEQSVHVYDRLRAAGEPLGARPVGLAALGSLRLEKGYRDYGHDVDNTDTVMEVGLGFTCDMDKPGGFIGKEAVVAQRTAGIPSRRLVQVLLQDPEPLLHHAEVLHRNDRPVGEVRAASYGHTLGGAIGLAMVEAGEPVNKQYITSGEWSVEVANQHVPATVSLRPLYDPSNARIKQ